MIEQIVIHGNEAIDQIESQLAEIAQRVKDAQIELVDLPLARRGTDEAREAFEEAEQEYNQAVAYAKLAHDTVNEQGAIKAVSSAKKALTAAKKNLEKAEHEAAEAEQRIATREVELNQELAQLEAETERLETELKHTRLAHKQAHRELGNQKHAAIIQELQEHRKRFADLKGQLIEAETELYDFIQNALQELADWPDLQREIAPPVDDSTSRMIEATMAYIKTIIQDIEHVQDFTGTPWSLWDTLIIPTQQIRGYPAALEERYERLEQILEAYRKR